MGILADFFIGTDDLASSIEGTSEIPASDKLESKNLLDLYVGYLYQISEGKETSFDNNLGFKTIKVIGDGEQITTKIPDSFRDILCNASDEDISTWAPIWASQEELMWPEEEAIIFIKDLRELASKAKNKRKSIFLWNCV